jgi:hypothetical protein
LNYIYLVAVKPVELLLGFLFGLWQRMTGDPGTSLLLMSLSVTLLTAPLYYLSERWKAADDALKARMAKEITSVKRHYEGQKRFYLLRNVHRLHDYSTAYTLRASFGLFVQIPFFFAAYELLSRHPGFAGVPFLFIRDLGMPDGLLGGVNLLPCAMTAINLCSSVAYNRSLSLKKNSTMVGMAILFLVLLYRSPAALLVYWTMNNVLSLAKNVFFPAARQEQVEDTGDGTVALAVHGLRELYGGSLYRPILLAALYAIMAGQSWWLISAAASFEYCIAGTAIAAAGLSLAAAAHGLRRQGPKRTLVSLAPLAATWLFFAASAYVLVFERRQNALISNRNIKLLSTILLDAAGWLAASRLGPASPEKPSRPIPAERAGPGVYVTGLVFIALFVWVVSPLRIYFSSPLDVGMGPLELVARNVPPMAAFFALGSLPLLAVLSKAGKASLRTPEAVVLAVIIAGFVFSALTGARYGILDEFALERAFLLNRPSPWLFLLDVMVLSGSVFAALYFCAHRRSAIIPALAVMIVAGSAQVAAAALKAEPGAIALATETRDGGGELPAGGGNIHSFNKGGRNVVFVIADMFNGNYLGRMLEERPELADTLDGFTWYPNVVATASHTATSLPSLYGGWEFEPSKLDTMPGTGKEKLGLAARKFFGGMMELGFNVGAVDPLYADYPAISSAGGRIVRSESSSYVGYWRKVRGQERGAEDDNPKNALLSMLTVFVAAPTMLKARIYDEGSWIVFRKSYQFKYIARKTLSNYAYLDVLPELSSASVEAKPLFLFIHTQFTHEPFGISEDGRIIGNGYPNSRTKSFIDSTSAFYTARAFVDAMVRWMDWMKREGVYDETLIIMVSDHGNNSGDQGFRIEGSLDNPLDRHELSRARSLLMVKPFGARGPVKLDRRLLGTADTPAILFNKLGRADGYGPNPVVGEATMGSRVLSFARVHGDWADFLDEEGARFTYYTVRGDIDDPAAWSKDKQ